MRTIRTIRVGSRDSELAVVQARMVMDAVKRLRPDVDFELVPMKTAGDKILDKTLDLIGGKGLFVKELDEALLAGRVDVCVHSYKDLPTPDNPELPVAAVGPREDPRDVLILPEGAGKAEGPLVVGTASKRRALQLSRLRPEWTCVPVRGNVFTRLRKLDEGRFGALVLAAAGVRRLGLWERVAEIFPVESLLPAACQGMLAVQGTAGGDYDWLRGFDDPESRDAARAERAFIEELDGGCSAPTAAYAAIAGDGLVLAGLHVSENGAIIRDSIAGTRSRAGELGRELARRMKGDKDG